ncbi:MAG: ABC transporter permease [Firmicutes bacterium]|nr:ABC transporter permease [Bacillota bacterium]
MFNQTMTIALKAIWSEKLRAILTMLGVIIGVAAVITLVGLARGATNSVTQKIQGLGSNLVTISIGSSP